MFGSWKQYTLGQFPSGKVWVLPQIIDDGELLERSIMGGIKVTYVKANRLVRDRLPRTGKR